MALFSTTVPCPYCYTHINPNALAFRCSGRAMAGKPACAREPDSARVQHFGMGEPVLPVIASPEGQPVLGKDSATCLHCGGESGIRVCPECHTMLPRSLDKDSPMFGLVGVRGAGKTVTLSVLHKELLTTVARRFNASIDTPGGAIGLARSFEMNVEAMRGDGRLPDQTEATDDKKKEPALYEWRYSRSGIAGMTRQASTIFSFYDNAGEDVATEDRALSQRYLGAASGIILMLDPFAFEANHARAASRGVKLSESDTPEGVLRAITAVLQTEHRVKRNRKVKIPLAVVISKIDAFFDEIPADHPLRQPSSSAPVFSEGDSQTVHDHVGSMIVSWGGDGLLRTLEQNYATFRLFGSSALGAEPDYATATVNTRGVLPHRVSEPLLWLMANRGFIPTGD